MSANLATTVAAFLANKRALGRKYRTEEASLRRKRSACGVMDRGGDLCLTGGGSGRSVPSIAGE
jgi:hypothetical protein